MNLLEQIYCAIDYELGSEREDQFLCLMRMKKPLRLQDLKDDSTARMIAESNLANVYLPPCHYAAYSAPTSFLSRYEASLTSLLPQQNDALKNITQRLKLFPYRNLEASCHQRYERQRSLHAMKQDFMLKYGLKSEEYRTFMESFLTELENENECLYQLLEEQQQKQLGFADEELTNVKAELERAKQRQPDGKIVLPVVLHPENWRQKLTSDFDQFQLLRSFYAYAIDYAQAFEKMYKTLEQMYFFLDESANQPWNTARNQLIESLRQADDQAWFNEIQRLTFSSVAADCPFKERLAGCLINHWQLKKSKPMRAAALSMIQLNEAYEQMITACETMNLSMAEPERLKQQFASEMQIVNQQMELMTLAAKRDKAENRTALLPVNANADYKALEIHSSLAALYETSSLLADTQLSLTGMNALFGANVPYGLDEEILKNNLQINLGFLARKIKINRAWFHPEFFRLSSHYCSINEASIAKGVLPLTDLKQEACLFPVYSTSFVLIKDLTLQFTFNSESHRMKDIFKRYVRQGYQFLCFCEYAQDIQPVMDDDGNTLTLRYAYPQLAGYFMHFTPADESQKL